RRDEAPRGVRPQVPRGLEALRGPLPRRIQERRPGRRSLHPDGRQAPLTSHMAFDARELRRVMGSFCTGVTVITTRDDAGRPFGLTANAITSVSLNPPLVLICVDRK